MLYSLSNENKCSLCQHTFKNTDIHSQLNFSPCSFLLLDYNQPAQIKFSNTGVECNFSADTGGCHGSGDGDSSRPGGFSDL